MSTGVGSLSRKVSNGEGGPGRFVPEGFCACPVDIAFNVMGRKWTFLLVRNLLQGQRRFNQLLASIEGINPKSLSQRLKELENERLVLKRVSEKKPVAIEYELTEKGFALLPILRQMVRWSLTYEPERVLTRGATRREVEACLEEWQRAIVGRWPDMVAEWRPEPVQVRSKKPNPA